MKRYRNYILKQKLYQVSAAKHSSCTLKRHIHTIIHLHRGGSKELVDHWRKDSADATNKAGLITWQRHAPSIVQHEVKSNRMLNGSVTLTLGPIGPRGPGGPLTPMAPCRMTALYECYVLRNPWVRQNLVRFELYPL